MAVEAVFFDAGSTLIYPDPAVGEVYARALRLVGIEAAADDVQRSFERASRIMRVGQVSDSVRYGRTKQDAMEWWRCVVRESFAPFGRPDAFEPAFRFLWGHFARPDAWGIYPDVAPIFDALDARGIGVGLISNWDVRLAGLLDALGLSSRIRWAVISCDVGAEKPDPVIFRSALGMCGLPPEKALHVGDDLTDDALGAARAGLRGVWLRREDGGTRAPEGVLVVRKLTEVLELLD